MMEYGHDSRRSMLCRDYLVSFTASACYLCLSGEGEDVLRKVWRALERLRKKRGRGFALVLYGS